MQDHIEDIPRAMQTARDSGWRVSGMTPPETSSLRMFTIMCSSSITCRLAGCLRLAATMGLLSPDWLPMGDLQSHGGRSRG